MASYFFYYILYLFIDIFVSPFDILFLGNYEDEDELSKLLDTFFDLKERLCKYPFEMSVLRRLLLYTKIGIIPEAISEAREQLMRLLWVSLVLDNFFFFFFFFF